MIRAGYNEKTGLVEKPWNNIAWQQPSGFRNLSILADSFLAAEAVMFFGTWVILMANCFFIAI